MERTKTTLDREPMTSETIRQRQNFDYVLKQAAAAKVPIWKSIWFYGPVGIAMVTLVVSAVRMNPKNELDDNKTTLAQNNVTGWTGSTQLGELATIESKSDIEDIENIEKEYTAEKSFEGSIPNEIQRPAKNEKPAVVEDNTVTLEENTELKPEVLTEEKNVADENRIESNKTVEKKIAAPVVETKRETVKTMPNVAGVFNGRVSLYDMCSTGISCNNGYQVVSYDIQYDNGRGTTVDRVSGGAIPEYICNSLRRYNLGSPVFITRIVAMNEKGQTKQLLSMQIEPTF
ncbi:MAG: hypothetical protein HWE22_04170 [Flavobacteriales bacterium]|nr:hypothetical protein [Flavobacteriales bacterium]